MSRRADRHEETVDQRVRLLEDDADRIDEGIASVRADISDKVGHLRGTAQTWIDGVKFEVRGQVDSIHADIADIRADVKAFADECRERDERTRKLLTGLLVSIVTLCVTVTVGVLVALGGG